MSRFLLLALAFALVGCAKPTSSVSGHVTYDGKPVEQGTITFHPADGKGTAASAEIDDGYYAIDNVSAGPKIVEVTATNSVTFPRTNEEMARQFAEAKARGKTAATVELADTIPRDAVGNNQTVEVKPGKQPLDLRLEKPSKKK
jgi:hypothetical protein